jgi:hypothetical protein
LLCFVFACVARCPAQQLEQSGNDENQKEKQIFEMNCEHR